MSPLRLALVTIIIAIPVLAAPAAGSDTGKYGYKLFSKSADFEDVKSDLKDAIINRGFVIDYVGRFNKMLERTSEVAGSVTESGIKSPYKNAQFLQFCPSKLTHDAVSMSPRNIANCPIAFFIYENRHEAGKIYVGYRTPISGPSKRMRETNKKIETMLHGIATEVTK